MRTKKREDEGKAEESIKDKDREIVERYVILHGDPYSIRSAFYIYEYGLRNICKLHSIAAPGFSV
jgi:hypothetical protein